MHTDVVDSVGELADRKTVLRRGGAAAFAGTLALMGIKASTASAYGSEHGCNLCNPPGSCGAACYWCWYGSCHMNAGGSSWHRTQCCEGYSQHGDCTGGCGGSQHCSRYGGNIGC